MPTQKALPADDPTGARAAQAEADARAEQVAKDRSIPAGLTPPPPQPRKINQGTQDRPADSGFVGGSPAERAERMGKYPMGGEAAIVDGKSVSPAERTSDTISNVGVPDVPAIKRHNEEVADSIEATAQAATAAGDTLPADAVMAVSDADGNRENTVEGVLAEKQAAAEKKKG